MSVKVFGATFALQWRSSVRVHGHVSVKVVTAKHGESGEMLIVDDDWRVVVVDGDNVRDSRQETGSRLQQWKDLAVETTIRIGNLADWRQVGGDFFGKRALGFTSRRGNFFALFLLFGFCHSTAKLFKDEVMRAALKMDEKILNDEFCFYVQGKSLIGPKRRRDVFDWIGAKLCLNQSKLPKLPEPIRTRETAVVDGNPIPIRTLSAKECENL